MENTLPVEESLTNVITQNSIVHNSGLKMKRDEIITQNIETKYSNERENLVKHSCGDGDKSPVTEGNTDVKLLDGDNKVDVEIEPDVKHNTTHIQLCSCSIILNCFS